MRNQTTAGYIIWLKRLQDLFPSWIVIGLAVALGLVAIFDGPVSLLARNTTAEITLRLMAAGLAVLLATEAARRREATQLYRSEELDYPIFRQKSDRELLELLRECEKRLLARPDLGGVYGRLVHSFEWRLTHVVEEYSLQQPGLLHRSVVQQAAFDHDLETAMASIPYIPFPVAILRKGALPDNLRVWLDDGTALPVMPYSEVLGLQLHVLRGLFIGAYGAPAHRLGVESRLESGKTKDADEVELQLLRHVAYYGAMDPTFKQQTMNLLDQLRPKKDERAAARVRAFVERYGEEYPFCVGLPGVRVSGSITVSYSRSVRLDFSENDGLRDRLRGYIGLQPYKFRFPLTLPYAASSYHFRMKAPPSQYLFTQYLQDTDGRLSVEKLSKTPDDTSPPYIRLRQRGAPPYAHLYIRDLNAIPRRQLATVVRFHEIPPGALGSAAILSFVLAAFVLALGALIPASYSLNSDVPALLLALPAVSAALLGQALDAPVLANTSLKTRLGLTMTFGLSGLGIVLYLAQANGYLREPGAHLSILGLVSVPIRDYGWLGLFGLAAANFAQLAVSTLARTYTYRNKLAQRQPVEEGALP